MKKKRGYRQYRISRRGGRDGDMSSEEWVEKADRDLKLAKLAMENDILDYALFHAQQAVEKYLKSFLVKNKTDFRKKHDIFYLLGMCIDIDGDILPTFILSTLQ